MGRFDGVLLISDFDNTLVYTSATFENEAPMPPIPERNLEAIRWFMEEGGLFTVATGRALVGIEKFIHMVPINAPAVVNNGAGIYDFAKKEYVYSACLPEESLEELEEVMKTSEKIGAEIYHESSLLEVVHPNHWTENHAKMTRTVQEEISALTDAEHDITKVVFLADAPIPRQLQDELVDRDGLDRYELVVSNDHLLEITRRGANKGNTVLELAKRCGVDPAHLYCAGDHANDLTMLHAAARAFAPANAIDEVKADPAVTMVCHSLDGAIAEVIDILKEIYPGK